jgi:hypothetical protein
MLANNASLFNKGYSYKTRTEVFQKSVSYGSSKIRRFDHAASP